MTTKHTRIVLLASMVNDGAQRVKVLGVCSRQKARQRVEVRTLLYSSGFLRVGKED